MKGIADTGFLVALANRHDEHHAWAAALAEEIDGALLTCDAVLAETAFHLRDAELVLAMVREGLATPVFSVVENLSRLEMLAHRYRDREPDMADLCLICLSEDHPGLSVFTTDKADFSVYRRFRRQMIPIIAP